MEVQIQVGLLIIYKSLEVKTNMKAFYKLNPLQVGQGTVVPDDFIVYTIGKEPQELIDALEVERVANELSAKIAEAKAYLASTDYKMLNNYVPKDNEGLDAIITQRNVAREFIRYNKA